MGSADMSSVASKQWWQQANTFIGHRIANKREKNKTKTKHLCLIYPASGPAPKSHPRDKHKTVSSAYSVNLVVKIFFFFFFFLFVFTESNGGRSFRRIYSSWYIRKSKHMPTAEPTDPLQQSTTIHKVAKKNKNLKRNLNTSVAVQKPETVCGGAKYYLHASQWNIKAITFKMWILLTNFQFYFNTDWSLKWNGSFSISTICTLTSSLPHNQ